MRARAPVAQLLNLKIYAPGNFKERQAPTSCKDFHRRRFIKKSIFLCICAVFIAATLFNGCADADDSDDVPPQELFGTYWGTMEVLGQSHDMCLVIGQNSVAIHSNKMGRSYPLIKYTDKKNGIWLVSCYNAWENKRRSSSHMTVTVNLNENPALCKVWIYFMSNMGFMKFPHCRKGEDYDGRFLH